MTGHSPTALADKGAELYGVLIIRRADIKHKKRGRPIRRPRFGFLYILLYKNIPFLAARKGVYKLGNDVVPKKHAVARKGNGASSYGKISAVCKYAQLFFEQLHKIGAKTPGKRRKIRAALLQGIYKSVQHTVPVRQHAPS